MTREGAIGNLIHAIRWNDMSKKEVLDMAIQALKQEPCEDAISRQAVLDITWEEPSYTDALNVLTEVRDKVKELPSVNPQEPKTGHWIEHPEIETSTPEYLMFYECSKCGDKQCFCKSDFHKKRFCSNCGAKMVEPQESEDKE